MAVSVVTVLRVMSSASPHLPEQSDRRFVYDPIDPSRLMRIRGKAHLTTLFLFGLLFLDCSSQVAQRQLSGLYPESLSMRSIVRPGL